MNSDARQSAVVLFLLLAGMAGSLKAATFPLSRVTLAWDSSPTSMIAGYRVYYGVSTANYTNVLDVGDVSSTVVSNLVPATTYFFAATSYDMAGLESVFSNEISYPVPAATAQLEATFIPPGTMRLRGRGTSGYQYSILTSSDLETWAPLADITMDASGSFEFSDSFSSANSRVFYRLQQISP